MFEDYLNVVVVVDTDGPHSYIGTLDGESPHLLRLRDVAIFDHRAARADYELYLVEARELGFPAARRELLVRLEHVIALGPLDAVNTP